MHTLTLQVPFLSSFILGPLENPSDSHFSSLAIVKQHALFFFFFFLFLKLYTIVLVLPNIEINPPQVYMCSPSRTLLPPPSPYHPSGSSQCTSPKHPYRAWNLDWRLFPYMILYVFQCHSPKSSHPLPTQRDGMGREEEGSGWGTHIYLWWIHFDIWQNQYNIVKLKNKIKLK